LSLASRDAQTITSQHTELVARANALEKELADSKSAYVFLRADYDRVVESGKSTKRVLEEEKGQLERSLTKTLRLVKKKKSLFHETYLRCSLLLYSELEGNLISLTKKSSERYIYSAPNEEH
jgi:hypothetical protein